MISSSPFAQRLAETATWCSEHVAWSASAQALRTPELRPEGDRLVAASEEQWAARVQLLGERRAQLLRSSGRSLTASPAGRLLLLDPGQSLSDGAAALESRGFFDEDNVPPWDTWVAFLSPSPQRPDRWTRWDSVLVSWVPAALQALVNDAIAVIPEECVAWVDRFEGGERERLLRAGLEWEQP